MSRYAFIIGVLGWSLALDTWQPPATAQSAQTFEVVSVRHSDPNARGRLISGPAPQGFEVRNAELSAIIQYAYRIAEYQLVDAPAWTRAERFDIRTKYPEGDTRSRVPEMVQSLLADRFALRVHKEIRQGATFELSVVRNDRRLGPNLRPTALDCVAYLASLKAAGAVPSVGPGDRPVCLMISGDRSIRASSRPIRTLAIALERYVGRRVVDRTELAGDYDFDLEWTPEVRPAVIPGNSPAPQASPDDNLSIYTALREQLGLELRSTTGPIEVVVVDSVQPPTPD